MKNTLSHSKSIAIIVLVVTVPAFILGPIIWPPPANPTPVGAQLPLLILLGLFESLALGIGIAFAAFGNRLVAGRDSLTKAAFWSTVWVLVNWWPHDGFHRVNGENLQGIIYIEYAFHVTLIIAGAVLAKYFWRTLRSAQI